MNSHDAHSNPPVELLEPPRIPDVRPEHVIAPSHIALSSRDSNPPPPPPNARGRRPGRPLEMAPDEVLRTIGELARGRDGLFRVHLVAPGLYARARRLFGSWSEAVRLAGIDYESMQGAARARSVQTRRRNRRRGASEHRAGGR